MIEIAGVEFEFESEMLDFIENKLYWLRSHNKNYTKDQYFIITMLFELMKDYNKMVKEKENETVK